MERNRYKHLRIRTVLAAHRDPLKVLRALERWQRIAQWKQSSTVSAVIRELRGAVLAEMSRAPHRIRFGQRVG